MGCGPRTKRMVKKRLGTYRGPPKVILGVACSHDRTDPEMGCGGALRALPETTHGLGAGSARSSQTIIFVYY